MLLSAVGAVVVCWLCWCCWSLRLAFIVVNIAVRCRLSLAVVWRLYALVDDCVDDVADARVVNFVLLALLLFDVGKRIA